MIARALFGLLLAAPLAMPLSALAQDDLVPMDTTGVDPDLLKDMYGPWVIVDESGDKSCNVVLQDEPTIGGSVIDVDPACAKVFPIMDEITAWRLMQGWGIDLVDATRKTRVRFTTPDDAYVAYPEVDGISTILQPVRE
ncbi:AprI/Inh family metalloprotease inhibitor [Mesorhizobium sp. BAC0120]|uniref:AprI/Inh family metalloprotease inhibitor n=1 Tax=Mesorhizobium sp. BAC0120 TaxID=3090670 RepID=UPI00298C947F|nr:AprI/Inh family metalloprotease inhibitor [Mesorhizobium sp. BAC0120]MDW6022111.1 AprI/Inh family metalloprotease inhibitor [Mesorhizobium sp. BAC0120]